LKVKLLTILAVAVFVFSSVMMAQAQTETSIWRDEMNYQSADQLQAGGWTITHAAGVSFSGGAIILDGTQEDTAIHYSNNFPSGIYDWKVEDRSRWTLGSHCGNSVTAVTDKHSYTFMADGWYSTYVLYRDGQKTTFGSFQENKNEWLTLSIEKQGNQINMYYNGELKSTYTETDTSSSNLIGVAAVSPWRGGSEYDYFQVWSTGSNVLTPQTNLLSNPIVIGGIVVGIAIGVGGVVYFFVLGGTGAAGSAGGAGAGSAIGSAGTIGGSGGSENSGFDSSDANSDAALNSNAYSPDSGFTDPQGAYDPAHYNPANYDNTNYDVQGMYSPDSAYTDPAGTYDPTTYNIPDAQEPQDTIDQIVQDSAMDAIQADVGVSQDRAGSSSQSASATESKANSRNANDKKDSK
jgi:hypothetical protein